MRKITYSEMTTAQKAEMTGELIEMMKKCRSIDELKAVGSWIADLEADERYRNVLKLSYIQMLQELRG